MSEDEIVKFIVGVKCVQFPEEDLRKFRCDDTNTEHTPKWAKHPTCIAAAVMTRFGLD